MISNKNNTQPDLTHESYWQGELYKFEIFLTNDFSKVKKGEQVYGFVLNDKNEILLVSGRKKIWILPGGGVEKGESYVDTLIREVYEEAAVVVDEKSIKPFFYQKVYEKEDEKWELDSVQLRFVCRVKKQDEFIKDPDGDMKYQLFVPIRDLGKYLKWGKTVGFIQDNIRRFI